jgi:phosphatidylserine/phosphatidylglycerophosphate/cardiolipin synthase-like enzyme
MMTTVQECLTLVDDIPSDYVTALIRQLRADRLPCYPNPAYAARIDTFLRSVTLGSCELAAMLEGTLYARQQQATLDLVWTGPTTPVLAVRQTEQVLLALIRDARSRLTLMSFGIFDVHHVIAQLEGAIARNVAVRIVVGERESQLDAAQELQRRQLGPLIIQKAHVYYWPPERRLRDEQGRPGLMHVKAAVMDGEALLISSANLTGDGLERNMELGLLIRGGDSAAKIERHVDALIAEGHLERIRLSRPSAGGA